MAKVDRLGWTTGLAFSLYGISLGVRTNAPDLLCELAERLPKTWQGVSSPIVVHLYSALAGTTSPQERIKRFHLLYSGSTQMARTLNRLELLDAFEEALHFDLGFLARGYVFVHAAVVSWNGRAIVIVGPNSSGRTTLLEAFMQAGGSYCSDRYAVFDAEGKLHAYPSALYLCSSDEETTRRFHPDQLGWPTCSAPVEVSTVLFTHFSPGAVWKARQLTGAEALVQLLPYAVTARSQPQTTLEILAKVASAAVNLKGKRGEARQLVARLTRQKI